MSEKTTKQFVMAQEAPPSFDIAAAWPSRSPEHDEEAHPEFGLAADWDARRREEAPPVEWTANDQEDEKEEEEEDEEDEEDEEEEEEPRHLPRPSIEDVTLEALLYSHLVVNCGGQEFHAPVMSALMLVSIVSITPATFFVGIGVGLPAFWLAQRCLAR